MIGMELIGSEDLSNKFKAVHFENGITYVKVGKYTAKIKMPLEVNKDLASLLGHVLGDGHIKKDEQHFHYTNKNKDLIEEVKLEIKNLFGIEIKEYFREEKQIYDLNFPVVIAKLLILCDFPKGRKSTQILSIPDWIKNGSLEIKSAFIRALFDDEAWVEIKQGGFCIGFGQNKKVELIESHKSFMEDIRILLSGMNIYTNNVYERSRVGDSIQLGFKIVGYPNLLNFSKEISFTSKQKLERLLFTLDNFKQIQYSKKEAKLKVLEELKSSPLKSKEIANRLNRDQKTIWKHLNQLRKRDLVIKIGTKNKVFWKANS